MTTLKNAPRAALAAILLSALAAPTLAQGTAPIKVGLMLPYSGTFAALGNMIESGFRLYVQEQGGRLGGREVQYFKVDDESEPSKATDNVNKLIKRDQVDVLVGTVHSGVALAMAKAVARRAVLDWEGVGDEVGNLVPVSPAGIDALLEIWPVFEAFQAQYVARGLMLDAEKNASAPSPTGPSAGATATARPVQAPARTALQG